jgi:hypothetical protein
LIISFSPAYGGGGKEGISTILRHDLLKGSKQPLFGYLCFEFCQKYKLYRHCPADGGERVMRIKRFSREIAISILICEYRF